MVTVFDHDVRWLSTHADHIVSDNRIKSNDVI